MTTNRINYDATFCGKLPLHQTNLIQPHGVVLLLSRESLYIIQGSENCNLLLGKPITELINKPFSEFIAAADSINLKEKGTKNSEGKLPITINFMKEGKALPCLTLVQVKQDYLLLEVELPQFIETGHHTFSAVYQQVKYTMAAMDAATSVNEVCAIAAQQIKAFSGFDKVMIYSFDKEWNGTVIAEEKEEGMERYLGLTFPASDIPKPAREMYFKNPYRLIPNREYVPVKLYPLLNPITNSFSDLSDTNLRSVAGVHLEYLKNMGVMCSMSIRIVYNGQLWGLIACHHRNAKYLSYELCSVFELLSDTVSSRISALQDSDAFKSKTYLNELHRQFVESIYEHDAIATAFKENTGLLKSLLCADGIAFCWNEKIEKWGATPDDYGIENIIYWLQSKDTTQIIHEPSLSTVFEEAATYSEAVSGLLALPIQGEQGNYILLFRSEAIKDVSWGGNPNEVITFEKTSAAYHPRNSFSIWQETVRHTAIPWSKEELEAAEQFRNFLIGYTLNRLSN